MAQKSTSKFIHIRQINQNNVNEIYQKQFNRFLFDFSDEVNIDGKIYGNKGEEKFKRFCLGYQKNEKGEPNFKQITVNGIKDGFKLTENDFIEYELEQIVDYTPKGLTEKKQLKTYKEYLEKRLSELNKSSEEMYYLDSKQPLKNYELFIAKYTYFFIDLEISDIERLSECCYYFEKEDIDEVSMLATTEVMHLLNTPNNNVERLLVRLKSELEYLKTLELEVYEKHDIENIEPINGKDLYLEITSATSSLDIFIQQILPLIENESNNTNKLSEAEQKEVLNTIQVDFIEFFRDEKLTKDAQINFIENQIKGMYHNFPETPRTDFFIERLKRLKEAIEPIQIPQHNKKASTQIHKNEYLKIIVDTYWSSHIGFPFIEALENKYNDTSQDLILSKQAFYNGCLDAANTIKDKIINGCKDLEENSIIINSPITIKGNDKKINLYKSGLIKIMGYNDISLNDVNTIIDELNKTIAQPQQETKTDAPTKKELDLKDFFVNTNEPTIIEIKNKFKNSADKDLAMLIYRLTELELVEIIPNNKKKSRKHFISALTGQPNKDMSYINRVLQNYDTTIQTNNNGKTYEITDNNYISVKNKLNDILNPKVV